MINLTYLVAAFLFMEFVAWSNHKYVMHGFLWRWHRDHHRKDHQSSLPLGTESKHFEMNDLFFLVYAIPAIVLLIVGLSVGSSALVYMGIGISLYGFTYFTIHDVIIHKRLNIPFLSNPKNKYLQAIIRAHTAHHWPKSRSDFHNFGLLVFPLRFLKK